MNILYKLTFFLFFVVAHLTSFSQTIVTPATGGNSICLNNGPSTSDYYNLSDIIIAEQTVTDFASPNSDRTYVIGFSGGFFEFEAGVGNVIVTGSGVSLGGTPITVTTNNIIITVAYYNASDVAINSIIISGIRVRATGGGSGEIRRTGGSINMNANMVGDAQNHATLEANIPPVANLVNDHGSVT
ncbi:hypothetical protein MNBD_BACTEROID06-1126, partial [hydrothermal vent metagenome]